MIHAHDVEGARPLGDTGLFVGGFVSALDLVDEGRAKPGDFKFFFNHLSWPAGALKEQVRTDCGRALYVFVRKRGRSGSVVSQPDINSAPSHAHGI